MGQPMEPYPPQSDSYSQPHYSMIKHFLMISFDVNLQTRRKQYGATIEIMTIDKGKDTTPMNDTLNLPIPPIDGIPKVPKFTDHCIANTPNARFAPNYSVVDDLAQSPDTMLTLEVLRNFPLQRKYLVSSLGTFNPSDSHLMKFYLDQ